MNKCAIFDLDGTLLNTIETISFYANSALKEYGFKEIPTERYKYLVGNGARILVERMLEETNNLTKENFDNVYTLYNNLYNADVQYLTEIYAGIPELLKGLKENNFKLAVLSNKPNEAAIEAVKFYFSDSFDIIYGAFEDLPKKPDPTILNKLLSELDCDVENSIYIGDTGVDMKTGKAGNLLTIGVLWGFRKKDELIENGADVIVSKPEEILEIINKE